MVKKTHKQKYIDAIIELIDQYSHKVHTNKFSDCSICNLRHSISAINMEKCKTCINITCAVHSPFKLSGTFINDATTNAFKCNRRKKFWEECLDIIKQMPAEMFVPSRFKYDNFKFMWEIDKKLSSKTK
jgi:hypothetical protein